MFSSFNFVQCLLISSYSIRDILFSLHNSFVRADLKRYEGLSLCIFFGLYEKITKNRILEGIEQSTLALKVLFPKTFCMTIDGYKNNVKLYFVDFVNNMEVV